MNYYKELHCKNGTVLSVDKLILEFRLDYHERDNTAKVMYMLEEDLGIEFVQWISGKCGSFHFNFKFPCSDGNSFWLGLCLNETEGKADGGKRCRIEFNPNKVADDEIFRKVYGLLYYFCHAPDVVRFDLACDYPVQRDSCYLIKDGRKYAEYRNSESDKTQYLGSHSNHGFVKLYNKQIESRLPIPLTRLELTLDWKLRGWDEVKKIFPEVLVCDEFQMRFDSEQISSTEKFILLSVLKNPDMLNDMKLLDYRKRKKIECILAEYTHKMEIERVDYNNIIAVIQDFVNWKFDFNKLHLHHFTDTPFGEFKDSEVFEIETESKEGDKRNDFYATFSGLVADSEEQG